MKFEKATLEVPKDLRDRLQSRKKPYEHNWQCYVRIILLGLEVDEKNTSVSAEVEPNHTKTNEKYINA